MDKNKGERSEYKNKRTWHAGKPKKKPDYNPATVTEELLEAVVNAYERLDEHGKHPSLQAIVDELDCGLNDYPGNYWFFRKCPFYIFRL